MAVYYVNLALIFCLAFPLCIVKPKMWKTALYLAIAFGYMWALAAFRQGIGFDYQSYIDLYELSRSTPLPSALYAIGLEPGFVLLNKLLGLFVNSSVVMYGIYELLMLAPVAWFIYRYCKTPWLSTWLYVTLTFFYTTMNFVRQGLACSVVVLSYKFLRAKRPVPYFLLILLASSFHKTALIMIPVYFLCHLKLNVKLGAAYGAVALILYMTSDMLIDIVTDYIFAYYKGSQWVTVGFPIHFVFVPALIFGACLALKPAWEKRDPDANLLLNLMLFSLIVWVFITKHFIIERFSMYIYIFVILALPAALSGLGPRPADLETREKLLAEQKKSKKGALGKEQAAALAKASQNISDHRKYYWCAVAAVLVVTLIYNDYGSNVNGFHGVFPYQSIFSWL